MPWQIDSSELMKFSHLAGQSPSGKIRVTTSRRMIDVTNGGFSSTENIYSGNPPELAAIIDTQDNYSYPSAKTRTQTTRSPIKQVIPGETGAGLIVAEIVSESYTYRGLAVSGCVGDIQSGTLQQVVTQTQRPLGTFADYLKYLRDKKQNPNPAPLVLVSRVVRTYEYDAKGRTTSISESTYEDPRSLAGVVKGIDWTTEIITGVTLTRRVLQSWTELRRNDWQYRYQEYDAWARTAPNSIPPKTPLVDQVEPVLVKSEVTTSTSQNQPPAAERAPARYTETTQNQKEILYFVDPAAPFAPKERVYTFDLLSAGGGGISTGGVSLWDLGTIAGQHEFGQANQVELLSAVADEWFTYRPYQSFRIDEPEESGIYAIAGATFVCNPEEFTIGCRGLLVGMVEGATVVPPYPPVPHLLTIDAVPARATVEATFQSVVEFEARYLETGRATVVATFERISTKFLTINAVPGLATVVATFESDNDFNLFINAVPGLATVVATLEVVSGGGGGGT